MSSNNQPAYWDSTCLGTAFPCWKCPGEITLCSSLTAPIFSGKKSEWESKKCTFRHISPHSFVGLWKFNLHITIVFCLLIHQKIGSDIFEWFPSTFFHFTYLVFKFYVLYSLSYLMSNTYPFFDLTSVILANLFIFKSSVILGHALKQYLWVQVWCARDVNKIFQGWLMEYLLHFCVLE